MIRNRLIGTAAFTPDLLKSPSAWLGHLPFAAWIVQEVSPRIFVELGTHYGHSYFSFCQSVVEGGISSKCYAVDTWRGDEHTGQYGNEIFAAVHAYNQERYGAFSRLLRMTFDDAAAYFSDQSIELLHIDGLHTYEAVRHDFETWLPKLAPGAVVMLHDTNVRERDFGVWKFWEELRASYPSNLEFLHSYGLGILRLNRAPEDGKLEWLRPASPRKQELIDYFAALGARQLERFELIQVKQRVASLDRTIAERNQAIAGLDQAMAELNRAVAARHEHVAGLDRVLAERDGRIAELCNSTSWRITSPLRRVAHRLKRFRHVAEFAGPARKPGGGSTNLFERAVQLLYRREGLAGIGRDLMRIATLGRTRPAPGSGEYDRNDYAEWVRRYDTLTDGSRASMRARVDGPSHKPLISVLMPVYNPPVSFLDAAIRSVRGQLYPNWELCIADDASTDPAVRELLEVHRKQDRRIKVVYRDRNGHISRASNSALELARGEFIALFDHDDLLAEHALYWVADAINRHPDAGLFYSDEDKVDESNLRYAPYFKCELNYELLLAQNMVCHLGVYRAGMVGSVGGFREGFEGAQDYDLALRVVEKLQPAQVVHIPRVLYHWRAIAGSTALAPEEKNYAAEAGRRAVQQHLDRTGLSAQVVPAPEAPALNRVRFSRPSQYPLVSIIIPTRDRADLLDMCLDSLIRRTTYSNYEVIIMDNGSVEDETRRLFDRLPEDRFRVLRDESAFNFSALNNKAARVARGDLLCLMNNDIEVLTPDWLEEMTSFAVRPDIGCVGARLWYPDGRLQHAGCVLGVGGVCGHSHKLLHRGHAGYFGRAVLHQSFSAVTGACLLVRRRVFEEVGGLDEKLVVAFNDVDFCLRVRDAGYRNIWTPYAEMNHHESASRGTEDTAAKRLRFSAEVESMRSRWGKKLFADPAYSPNLTFDSEDFSYAWPPRVAGV